MFESKTAPNLIAFLLKNRAKKTLKISLAALSPKLQKYVCLFSH